MSITISNVNIDNSNVYNTFIPSKVCSKCHQNKPLTKYNKNK